MVLEVKVELLWEALDDDEALADDEPLEDPLRDGVSGMTSSASSSASRSSTASSSATSSLDALVDGSDSSDEKHAQHNTVIRGMSLCTEHTPLVSWGVDTHLDMLTKTCSDCERKMQHSSQSVLYAAV